MSSTDKPHNGVSEIAKAGICGLFIAALGGAICWGPGGLLLIVGGGIFAIALVDEIRR